MTGVLASVRNIDEAIMVSRAGVDILDLKEPGRGALGEVTAEVITDIVTVLAGKVTISATIGDEPMTTRKLEPRISAVAATGTDFIKVGVFSPALGADILTMLNQYAADGIKIVLVFFADHMSSLPDIEEIAANNVCGIMLDTRNKQSGNLLQCQSRSTLSEFVRSAQANNMLTGLAGSLKEKDIPELMPLRPDYLGFRGGLCHSGERTGEIDEAKVRQLINKVKQINLQQEKEEMQYGSVA